MRWRMLLVVKSGALRSAAVSSCQSNFRRPASKLSDHRAAFGSTGRRPRGAWPVLYGKFERRPRSATEGFVCRSARGGRTALRRTRWLTLNDFVTRPEVRSKYPGLSPTPSLLITCWQHAGSSTQQLRGKANSFPGESSANPTTTGGAPGRRLSVRRPSAWTPRRHR